MVAPTPMGQVKSARPRDETTEPIPQSSTVGIPTRVAGLVVGSGGTLQPAKSPGQYRATSEHIVLPILVALVPFFSLLLLFSGGSLSLSLLVGSF